MTSTYESTVVSAKYVDMDIDHQTNICKINVNGKIVNVVPYTEEYLEDIHYCFMPNQHAKENDNVSDFMSVYKQFDTLRFFPSYEGSIIRVYFDQEWKISTNNKSNAFSSKWSSNRSFGEMFLSGLNKSIEEVTNVLDQNKLYSFLVCTNQETQIVFGSDSMISKVMFISSIDNNTGNVTYAIDSDMKLTESAKELKFDSYNQLITFVKNLDPTKYQGVIAFTPNNTPIKIINTTYKSVVNLRSNEPNVVKRFYELTSLHEVYVKFLSRFNRNLVETFERKLQILITMVQNIYFQRYIKHNIIQTSPFIHFILKGLHCKFIQTKAVTNINMVSDFVRSLCVSQFYNVYNELNKIM